MFKIHENKVGSGSEGRVHAAGTRLSQWYPCNGKDALKMQVSA